MQELKPIKEGKVREIYDNGKKVYGKYSKVRKIRSK